MRTMYLKPVLVFSGIGTQWPGMGADLLESEPAFLEGVSNFDKEFTSLSGKSPLAILRDGTDTSASFQGHPCVIAVEIGLFSLLRSKMVKPAAIIGHSGGEVAAAYAAGALTLQDAARVSWEHTNILERVAGLGVMAHISLKLQDLKPFLAGHPEIAIAAINSPQSIVIAGPAGLVKSIVETVSAATGAFCRVLRIDSSLHTPAVEPFLDAFEHSLSQLRPSRPITPIYSSLHGGPARPGDFNAAYWRAHIRQPIAFSSAVGSALATDSEVFLEIAPHAVLRDAIMDCAHSAGRTIQTATMMNRGEKAAPIIAEALAVLNTRKETHASTPAATRTPDDRTQDITASILQAAPGKQTAMISKVISDCLIEVSGGAITPAQDQPFVVMGVTSLLVVKLRKTLCDRLNMDLPPSIIYSYPTIPLLAEHIRAQLDQEPATLSYAPARQSASPHNEPLAIVGFSCRLPGGVNDPESLWTLLKNGVDAVIKVPPDRWDSDRYYDPNPEAPGMTNTREGGFLTCPIDQFDAPFFGISAREARQLDPQQRLLLEMMWEAFERAGKDITHFRNTRTGVFIGMSSIDYSHAHRDSYRRDLIDAYSLTGTTFSGAAGRLAYLYDFRGPCFTVDTACSSSIVALHCACRSLREGESNTVVVGGVNLMLIPDLHIAFTKLGAVSADGRSKSFDDGANGYGRGEGCVMLIIKRLSDAERDGDSIVALIRGTAINQDGKSNGLTAPNGLAQKEVIADALADAQLEPNDISYIEAHGTGTALGDSIEIQSLAEAYCACRSRDNPLMVGSIKSNVAHLEPAAAVAGIAKIICAMKHHGLPANIHIKTPNTRFDWSRYSIVAPTSFVPWEPKNGIRRAGISAFGFSGTNGHVILEEYIPKTSSVAESHRPPAFMLPLSAKSPESLETLKKQYAEQIATLTDNDLASFCFTSLAGRTHHHWRMAVSGADGRSIADAMRRTTVPEEPAGSPEIVMVFTGQGSQYPNMGKELYECFPVFTTAIDECSDILRKHGVNLLRLLYGGCSADELEQTINAQPVIASIGYALWKLWTSWGVKPAIVVGHSIGEYPAAVAAGIMKVEDMLSLVAARARAMGEMPPNGSMAAVFAPETTIRSALAGHDGVVIAAVNAPEAVTLSGITEQVQAVCRKLANAGVKSKELNVSHAFHSPLMSAAAEMFRKTVAKITFHPPKHSLFVSTVTGQEETHAVTEPEYWVNQILQPVRFADAVTFIAGSKPVILEAGGTAALSGLIKQSADGKLMAISSLSPKTSAGASMFEAAARLYTAGVDLDGARIYQPFNLKKIDIPTYPFDRKRHWMQVHSEPPTGNADSHPVLGARLESPAFNGSTVFESIFDDKSPAFLHEHIIYGKPISPGAGHLAMLFAAVREIWGSPVSELRNVDFLAPLVVTAGNPRRVQLILESPRQTSSAFRLVSRSETSNQWTEHCRGTIVRTTAPKPDKATAGAKANPAMRPVSKEDFYKTFINAGYEIGKGFQRIEAIQAADGEALCHVTIREGQAAERGHVIYPGAVDSIIQTGLPGFMFTYMSELLKDGSTIVPMHIDKVVLWCAVFPDKVVCHSHSKRVAETIVSFHIMVMSPDSDPLMEIDGLEMRQTDRKTLYRSLELDTSDWLYTRNWLQASTPATNETGELIVINSGTGPLASLIHARRGGILINTGDSQSIISELTTAVGRGIKTIVITHDTDSETVSGDPTNIAMDNVMMFIETAKQLIKQDLRVTLWIVTCGATGPEENPSCLTGAALWGAAMSLAAEDSSHAGGILDTDRSDASIALVSGMIGDTGKHPFGAIRNGQYYAMQLVRTSSRFEAPPVRSDRTYLVTGGSGALGLQLAQRLIRKGARTIALISRNGIAADAVEKLKTDGTTQCRVENLRYDISKPDDVTRLIGFIDDNLPPLAGVFHAAGVLDDATIAEMSREKIDRVMYPKVRGAWLLHQAAAGRPLDWFVLFSSAAALLGSGGQSNYAAANTMMNELAVMRHHYGLPALSVCWGPWAGDGMAAGAKRGARLASNGILELDPEKALDALETAAGTGKPVVGIMAMDWDLFVSTRTFLHGNYLDTQMANQTSDKTAAPVKASELKRILENHAPDQKDRLIDELSRMAARTLGFADDAHIVTNQPLMEQGFDSLMAVEIRNRLVKETGVNLPASFLFSHPTIEKMANWFAECSAPKAASEKPVVSSLLDEIDSLLK